MNDAKKKKRRRRKRRGKTKITQSMSARGANFVYIVILKFNGMKSEMRRKKGEEKKEKKRINCKKKVLLNAYKSNDWKQTVAHQE